MKVIISAGGTGGHFFPAIAIAEELKKRFSDCEILFIGTGRELESTMVKGKGFKHSGP